MKRSRAATPTRTNPQWRYFRVDARDVRPDAIAADDRRQRASKLSFLEYAEYPFVSADEIKKALKLKDAFSHMLDQMQ
jgi:hypothetical protein